MVPRDVVRHDGDDPYLVVAADKGTATFSDTANAIAAEYGFWLGDAFALGGSAGYDHKAMGITAAPGSRCSAPARSTSISRRLTSPRSGSATCPATCSETGCCSSDTSSWSAPSTTATFSSTRTRIPRRASPSERLFRLPGSSWADYGAALTSKGGGAFLRDLGEGDLARPAAVAASRPRCWTLSELIQAILRAPVDLLWNGGIGTYVKAHGERHAEVGDRANDAVRVDAEDLRARGRRGREPRLHPARPGRVRARRRPIFKDADDNSAGVDWLRPRGQHQDPARRDRRRWRPDREAAERAARRDDHRGGDARPAGQLRPGAGDHEPGRPGRLDGRSARAVRAESRAGRRAQPRPRVAPQHRGVFEERRGRRRPGRARVRDPPLAHEDRALTGAARHRPSRRPVLQPSFPRSTSRRDGCASASPTSCSGTRCVARSSPPGSRTTSSTGPGRPSSSGSATSRAPRRTRSPAPTSPPARSRVSGSSGPGSRRSTEGAGGHQTAMLLRSRILLERTTRWLLRHRRRPLHVAETVARYAPGFAAVAEAPSSLLGALRRRRRRPARRRSRTSTSRPTSPGTCLGCSRSLFPRLDLVEIAAASGSTSPRSPRRTSRSASDSELRLRDRIVSLLRDTRWAAMARAALRDDVYAEQAGLTKYVVRSGPNGQPGAGARRELAGAERFRCRASPRQVLADIRSGGALDLARLSVAVRELRNLIQSSGAAQAAEPAAAPPTG